MLECPAWHGSICQSGFACAPTYYAELSAAVAVVERETSAWPASSAGSAHGAAQGTVRFPRAHAMCAYTLVPPEPEMLVVEDCLADRRCGPTCTLLRARVALLVLQLCAKQLGLGAAFCLETFFLA